MASCLVPPEIKEPFAEWVLDILKPLYEADPQILGDYVFALLEKKTEPIAELRQLCINELQDFLREHTEAFVNLLFAKLTKGFGPAGSSSSSSSSALSSSSSMDRDSDRHSSRASQHSSRRYDEQGPPRDRDDYHGRGSSDRYYDERSGRGSSGRMYERPPDSRRDAPRRDRDDFYSSTERQGDVKRQRSTAYDARRDEAHHGRERDRDNNSSSGSSSYNANGGSPTRSGSSSRGGGDHRDSRGGGREHYRDDRDEGRLGAGGAGGRGRGGAAMDRTGDRHHDHDRERERERDRDRDDRDHQRHHRTATDPPSLTTILVEHIPDHHNNVADLIEQFGSFGRIITANAKPSQQKAFIQFATKDQAEAALSSPSPIFNNRFITISMANRSKHLAVDPSAPWASSKPGRGAALGGRGGAAASGVPRALPSRDQLKLVKPATATATDEQTEQPEQEDAAEGEDDTHSTSPSSSSSSSSSSSTTTASVKPAPATVTNDLLRRQLETQKELFELLKKPGLKPETRDQLKKQLRALIESSESGVIALNSATKQTAAASTASAASTDEADDVEAEPEPEPEPEDEQHTDDQEEQEEAEAEAEPEEDIVAEAEAEAEEVEVESTEAEHREEPADLQERPEEQQE